MKTIIRALILIFPVATALAQENSDTGQANREFLKPIDAVTRNDLMSRRGLEIRSQEFFAKPGRFDVYKFDIEVLENTGETITITPFDGPPIEIVSKGIKREPETAWFHGRWSGEIKMRGTKETVPIEWGITTWSIATDGSLQAPDPNREYTLSQLDQKNAVIPQESYLRRNEKIVYAVSGAIRFPQTRQLIRITQPTNDLEYLVFYEVDEYKWIPPGDGNLVDSDLSEVGQLRTTRKAAYLAHIENVKRDLGLAENQE